jgi:hypothetical protein
MLKVTLHSSSPKNTSSFNVMGRMDIAYEKLAARATYKTLTCTTGIGEHAPVLLTDYPRWSGNLWDLVARVACQTFYGEETLPEIPAERRPAFIENLTAVIEHWPDGLNAHIATLGIAHVQMSVRKGLYRATFQSDALPVLECPLFIHKPAGLNPWDLLARAYAWATSESFVLPARPQLCTHIPLQEGPEPLVHIDTIPEPARTGLIRWMHKLQRPYTEAPYLEGDCVLERQFVEFLEKAI